MLCHTANPPPTHTNVYTLSRSATLGDPLFRQHATQLCQRSCRIVVAQNTASGIRLKDDVFTCIYTLHDIHVLRHYTAPLNAGFRLLCCFYNPTEESSTVCQPVLFLYQPPAHSVHSDQLSHRTHLHLQFGWNFGFCADCQRLQ